MKYRLLSGGWINRAVLYGLVVAIGALLALEYFQSKDARTAIADAETKAKAAVVYAETQAKKSSGIPVATPVSCTDKKNDGTSLAVAETQAKEQYERAKNLVNTFAGTGDNYQQAEAIAEKVRQSAPQSPYAILIVAELKSRQFQDYREGSPGEILALTDKVISIDPCIADPYVLRSKLFLLARDILGAQTNAEMALKLDAKNKEAMFAKAQVEEFLKRFPEAEQWYRKAIDANTDPDRKANIYYWLAEMYLKMTPPEVGRADEAMKKHIELSPNAPWRLGNYASFLNSQLGDYDQAAEYAKKALAIMEFRMARVQLGMARYGKWSVTYAQIQKPTATELARAKATVAAIEEETGVGAQEAQAYASKYMPRSGIPAALTSAGLL